MERTGGSALAVGFGEGSVGVEANKLSVVSVGANWVVVGVVRVSDVGKVKVVPVAVGRGLSLEINGPSVGVGAVKLSVGASAGAVEVSPVSVDPP